MDQSERNIYANLSEAEKLEIHENARQLSGLLSIWCSCYPVIRAVRIEPVSVLVASVLPRFSMQQLLLASKIILFIFAIDDLADERLISYRAFRERSKVWAKILRTGEVPPELQDDDLCAILREVYNEISLCPHFNQLQSLWLTRFAGLTEGMQYEYAEGLRFTVGGRETLPPLREYIEYGINSAGTPWWSTSILVMLSEPEILDQIEAIQEIIRNTGAAIRLYNDARTFRKEIQETNVNSVLIVQHTLQKNNRSLTDDTALEQAHDIIRTLAGEYAQKSEDLVSRIRTGTGYLEMMIRRLVGFHAYFYGSRRHAMDYHTISQSDAFALIHQELQ